MHQTSRHSIPTEIVKDVGDPEYLLPGSELVHVMHIASEPDQMVIDDVSGRIREMGASIDSQRVVRTGLLLTQIVRLRGVSDVAIRAMREELLALKKVLRIRVEHIYLCDAEQGPKQLPSARR